MRATVKWFNAQKGYGFLIDSEGKDYFVHYTSIKADGFKSLDSDDIVEFEVGEGTTGKEQAVNVTPILTVKSVEKALQEENLYLKSMKDAYGVKKYLVVNADDVLRTSENGMTLVEAAAFAGIDVEGLQ